MNQKFVKLIKIMIMLQNDNKKVKKKSSFLFLENQKVEKKYFQTSEKWFAFFDG